MLEHSILGKLYTYWQYSIIYCLLGKIYRFFSNAYNNSLTKRILLSGDKIKVWYEKCLVSKICDSICNWLINVMQRIATPFKTSFKNSAIVALSKGSCLLKYDTFVLAAFSLMFVLPHNYWRNSFAILFAGALLIVQIVLIAANKNTMVYPKELGLPFALFALSVILGYFPSDDKSDSVRCIVFFFAAFIFLWLTIQYVDSKEKLFRFVQLIYVITIVMAFVAFVQRIIGIEPNEIYTDQNYFSSLPGRVFSTVENPNNYAEIIVLFLPLSAAFTSNIKNNTMRFICTCSLGLPVLALLMTFCRSGWISIALAVLVYVYFTNKKLIPWVFILALVMLPFLPENILIRIIGIFNTKEDSASFRFGLWQASLAMLSDKLNWLTGVGVGSSTYVINIEPYASDWINSGAVHSQMLYIELFVEMGLLGAFSFGWFFIQKMKEGIVEIYKSNNLFIRQIIIASVSSFAGLLMLSIFEYIWFYPRVLFAYFIIMGLMISAIRLSKSERI